MVNSDTNLFEFILFTEVNQSQNTRGGETKLSEKIKFGSACSQCQYVILGISEDIGPQMNGGLPGANHGFTSVVQAIQSVQSNKFLDGGEIGILGEIKQTKEFTSASESIGWVEELDAFVFHILQQYVHVKQQLIVVGGGHNNAYPLLKFAQNSAKKKVQSINIDPHADCRATDFRHSGNPFSYAINEGVLENYAVFGLHESYNNAFIFKLLEDKNVYFNTFEKFIDDEVIWWIDWKNYYSELNKELPIVLDIDLDAIQFSPSSALTPSGFTIEQTRKLIRSISSHQIIKIFHLPEGAPKTKEELRLYGKMVSYFVLDFIKGQNSKM